jgi:hypothetical protein
MANEIYIRESDVSKLTTKPAEVLAILDRANAKGAKPADLAAMRKVLSDTPELWRLSGDLAEFARSQILQSVPLPPTVAESARVGAKAIAQELGGKDAPLIERMIIEQAVSCWLQLSLTQFLYSVNTRSGPIERGDYWERRLSATQRRYLRAIETLARVRRLLRPNAVQVNIGAQQVNVMGKAQPAANGK